MSDERTFTYSSGREVIICGWDEWEIAPGIAITVTTDASPESIDKAFHAIDRAVADVKKQLAQDTGGLVIVAGPESQDTRRKL